MKTYKLIAFDADGTLRRCTVLNQPCPNGTGEWELLPGVRDRLAQIDWTRTAFGVVSNQAGITYGYMTEEAAYRMLVETTIMATDSKVEIENDTIWVCPHAPQAHCSCRKPEPELLRCLMASKSVSPTETLFVGDMASDRACAKSAGCDFAWAHDFFGWKLGDTLAGKVISLGIFDFADGCRTMARARVVEGHAHISFWNGGDWIIVPASDPDREALIAIAHGVIQRGDELTDIEGHGPRARGGG